MLSKYAAEKRIMKGCEPRDLLNKVNDICKFEGRVPQLTAELLDLAWGNYFGTAHAFGADKQFVPQRSAERAVAN